MGNLDAFNAFPGATEPSFPHRESESWRRPRPPAHEHSGVILHNPVPPSAVGLFRFRLRAWFFLLLVRQNFWSAHRGWLDAATNRDAEPLPDRFRCDLDFLFQLRAMVVLLSGDAPGNDC